MRNVSVSYVWCVYVVCVTCVYVCHAPCFSPAKCQISVAPAKISVFPALKTPRILIVRKIWADRIVHKLYLYNRICSEVNLWIIVNELLDLVDFLTQILSLTSFPDCIRKASENFRQRFGYFFFPVPETKFWCVCALFR